MARRSKADAEKTREQLLDVAAEMFGARGFSATSLTEICDKLEITKGALFHHFPSKDELFREVWRRMQIDMDAKSRDAAIRARNPGDPYAAFLAGCRTYLNYAAQRDFQQVVLIDGPSVLGLEAWHENDHDLGIQNVTAGLRYFSNQGLISTDRIEPLAIMLMGALNGAGFALARDPDGVSPAEFHEAFETLVKSMR